MKDHEGTVRKAAQKLHDAIAEAEAAGYRVLFPRNHGGLPGIAISETGKRAEPVAGLSDAASDVPDDLKNVMADNSAADEEVLASKGE